MMRTILVALALGLGVSVASAHAATRCVGSGTGCFPTLQAAVVAAQDGDTIRIGRGTFAGGVTIDKSVTVVGAGAQATTISGGGPVLTIARAVDPAGLTVSISGVTITGGVNDSTPDTVVTFGGGVYIPVAQLPGPPFNGTGATVAITDSVVTGNTVTSHEVNPFCGFPCGFNDGGGIDNGGVLTLTDVQVTNNVIGLGSATGASAGGINNRRPATLVMRRSLVSGNRVAVSAPDADFAESGGVGSAGVLAIEDSVVRDNSVEYSSSAATGEQAGLAGGIGVFGNGAVTATIRSTVISRNRVLATSTSTDALPAAFAGGLIAGAPLLIEKSIVGDNSVHSVGAGDAIADAGGIEIDAPTTIRDSLVQRNSVLAEAQGAALADGGGIANLGNQLTIERTIVTGNTARATGAGGVLPFGVPSHAFGGGVWSNSFGDPNSFLSLTDSVITANSVSASPGFFLQGGGLYLESAFTRTRTVIAGNRPDQCRGC